MGRMSFLTPNRVAVYLTALAGLATAVAGPVADLDTRSTATVIAGFAGIAITAVKWLDGWQKHEARVVEAAGNPNIELGITPKAAAQVGLDLADEDEPADAEFPAAASVAVPESVPADRGDARPVKP